MEKFNFINKFEKFRESSNFTVYKRFKKFRLILYSIKLNYISLTKRFKEFHVRESEEIFWSNDLPFLRWNIQKHLTTDILNYLSAASSIIDISRKFSERELDSKALKAYQDLVKKYFEKDIELKLIRKLRNYILHYTLLDVGVHANWNHIKGKSKSTYLSTEELLKWNDWNTNEREFLLNKGKQWNIEPAIYRYHETFLKVQDILFLSVIMKNKSILQELVNSMETIYNEGIELEMSHNLPFRKSTFRYLKYILDKIKTSANNAHDDRFAIATSIACA